MIQRNVLWVCLLGMCLAMAGCGRDYSGPQRYPLSGKVTIDGEIVDEGSIAFTPLSGGDLRAAGGEIVNGTFSVPEEKGPNAGTYRVSISWLKKTGEKFRAPDTAPEDNVFYDERKEAAPERVRGPESELTVEVPSSDGTYDFDLKTAE